MKLNHEVEIEWTYKIDNEYVLSASRINISDDKSILYTINLMIGSHEYPVTGNLELDFNGNFKSIKKVGEKDLSTTELYFLSKALKVD